MPTTRAIEVIKNELNTSKNFLYSEKLRLAIEYHIAQLPKEQQKSAWNSLPYLIQYGPVLAKRWSLMPDVRLVNPGIIYGWLTEYNKDKVYNLLPEKYSLQQINIDSTELPTYDAYISPMREIWYPCMLKANEWERWVGIFFISDEQKAKEHYKKYTQGLLQRVDSSIQAFATYKHEYCMQFYQFKDQAGIHRMVSWWITWRDIPFVVGDGKSTVHELIQQSWLTKFNKNKIIKQLEVIKPNFLKSIPQKDNEVKIIYTANIDFGTVFRQTTLDSEQQQRCEAILRDILKDMPPDIISVGRFDIKADSVEDILAGRLEIIELNAAGGIPTHVYSEKLSVEEKYNELDKHFSIMMNIADARRSRYTGWLERLLARPEFLSISYQSLAKKWISLFPSGEKSQLHKLKKEILKTIRISRWSRWKARMIYLGRKCKRLFSGKK